MAKVQDGHVQVRGAKEIMILVKKIIPKTAMMNLTIQFVGVGRPNQFA